MLRFAEVFKETGVDSQPQSMIVGLGGANLAVLHDAKGFALSYDVNKLNVLEVTRAQIGRVSSTLNSQFMSWNLTDDDSAKTYSSAVHTALNFGIHSRLLLVTGKVPGFTELKAVSGSRICKLDVAVLPHTSFTLAFKFLQALDDSGRPKNMTSWTPQDAQWLTSQLNWIYGPQANISFDRIEADWVRIDKPLDDPLPEKEFLSSVVDAKSKAADLTIFFVGRWKGGDAGGTYFYDQKAAVVESNPSLLPVTPGSDPFRVNLAHEVAHFLIFDQDPSSGGTHHHDRPDILLSNGIQSCKLDRQLVLRMNKAS